MKKIPVWMNTIEDSELEYLNSSVKKCHIMEGPVLKEFEAGIKEVLGIKYVIGTASGTAALALALLGIGLEPGDEIIVPDMTFIATANAAKVLGARVVSAPIEQGRPILDFSKIDNYISDRTKAIITVDLNGRISWSKELVEKYHNKGIYIIDDSCQAFLSGKDGKMAGTQADLGCFSFGITKTVTCVNGGAVVTNNEQIYNRMRIIKTQGMESVFNGDKYIMPGFNFKLPDVLAAVGVKQLNKINEKKERMISIDRLYREGLKDIEQLKFIDRVENEFIWMTDILCDDRDALIKRLAENSIISRPAAPPLHTASYIENHGNYDSSFFFSKNMLFLPSGPNQTFDNVKQVINVIRSYFDGKING